MELFRELIGVNCKFVIFDNIIENLFNDIADADRRAVCNRTDNIVFNEVDDHRVNLLNKKRNDAVAEYKSLNKKSDKLVEVAEFHSLNGGADKEVAVSIKELFNDVRNAGGNIVIAFRTGLTVTGSDESVHISDNAVELFGSSSVFGGSSYGSLGDIV